MQLQSNNNPSLAYDIQINSLRNTIDLCKNSGNYTNQIVFLSSSTVYGDFKEKSVDETTRPSQKAFMQMENILEKEWLEKQKHYST